MLGSRAVCAAFAVCRLTDGKYAFRSRFSPEWSVIDPLRLGLGVSAPRWNRRDVLWLQKILFLIHTYYLGRTRVTAGDKGREQQIPSLQPDVFVSDISVVAGGVFLPGELR